MSDNYTQIARRLFDEAFSQGKLEVADELVADGFVDHETPGAQGPEGLKQVVTMYRSAFPDLKMTVDDMIVDGDKMAVRFTATGTHQGEFAGIPATGKSVSIGGIDIFRFENNKLVEHWGYGDQVGLMQQLGALPAD
jgi:steroid delta-isomerase-like uncharacterized protein